jgi:hypothetical protein
VKTALQTCAMELNNSNWIDGLDSPQEHWSGQVAWICPREYWVWIGGSDKSKGALGCTNGLDKSGCETTLEMWASGLH